MTGSEGADDGSPAEGARVLEGVRVLDFGRYIAGPWCATLLGDMGAEVIRIEKTSGSEDRFLVPLGPGADGALFLHLGRNKQSVTLDPRSDAGREIVRKLVATADVVVANLPPRGLRAMGLDYETLKSIKPDIILTTATGFGTGGPGSDRLGFDGVAQAASGAMHLSGHHPEPMKTITPYVDFGTGTLSAYGTLAALVHRNRTGEGQHVEASLLGTALAFLGANLTEEAALATGRVGSGNRSQHAGPADVFRTTDGWIIVQCIGAPLFRRWCRLLDREDLLDEPGLESDQGRGDNGPELSRLMAEWCGSRTSEEALARLEEAGVPAGPVLTPRQALEDDHVRAMGFFRDVEVGGAAEDEHREGESGEGVEGSPITARRAVPVPTLPLRFSTLDTEMRTSAPTLGQDTEDVLSRLGYTAEEIAAFREDGVV